MLSIDALFKGRHFDREIIILCVRWYLRFKLSFRDLVEMMAERGIELAHTTIMRWIQRYVPEFEKRWNRFACKAGRSWRVDETYVKIKGSWTYLYRAVDRALSRSALAGVELWPLSSTMTKISYAGYRFPPVIIQQAIWLYAKFTLSFRDVEDLLAERGIAVSYETVRRWVNHFGPIIVADLRKRRPKPHTTWHLDEGAPRRLLQ